MQIRPLTAPRDCERYADFAAEVYRGNPHWVPLDRHHLVALLSRKTPESSHCRIQPFAVESEGRIVATVSAVIDETYNRHWNESAGHLLFFEALPDAGEAAVAVLRAGCDWLALQGANFARHGFLYGWQMPLTIDAYDVAPTFFHTYNPPRYHAHVKNAGFYSEKGVVEFRVEFTDVLAARYREMIARAGSDGVRLRAWDFTRLEEETELFTGILNRTFAGHWGSPQFLVAEMSGLTLGLKEMLAPEFTAFAEVEGETVGAVFALPDLNQSLRGQPVTHGALMVIGVVEGFRGKGINLALAARSYLAMMERGYRSASYTTVLDDNWPSRRTAEKLGASIARNFLIYRRNMV